MAWKPIQPRQRGPSPFVREIISRTALALVATALLFASFKCLAVVKRAWDEVEQLQPRPNPATVYPQRNVTGTGLPMLVGIALGIAGLSAAAGALLPSRFFELFVHPPGDPHEEGANVRRFFRWMP